jgi:hypothetical protein
VTVDEDRLRYYAGIAASRSSEARDDVEAMRRVIPDWEPLQVCWCGRGLPARRNLCKENREE